MGRGSSDWPIAVRNGDHDEPPLDGTTAHDQRPRLRPVGARRAVTCSDASGELVAPANTHGVTTVLRALVEGIPLPDGGQLPATALVGRLTKVAHIQEAFQLTEHGVRIRHQMTPPGHPLSMTSARIGRSRSGCTAIRTCSAATNAVTLTGAHNASTYGAHMASALAHDLAKRGHVIVSDRASASTRRSTVPPCRAAPSIAVLPCGVDRPHPAADAALFGEVRERGLVLSSTRRRRRRRAHGTRGPGASPLLSPRRP